MEPGSDRPSSRSPADPSLRETPPIEERLGEAETGPTADDRENDDRDEGGYVPL